MMILKERCKRANCLITDLNIMHSNYKREDERWKRLQNKLKHYKLPSKLNSHADLPRDICPIFKDTSELSSGNLPEQIQRALELSKYLIVVSPPRSAKTEWVNIEIEMFLSMGRTNHVLFYS